MSKFISGGYSVGVPPLPIPNREVKPVRADGTAYSGRVGSRRPFRLSAALEKVSPQRHSLFSGLSFLYSWAPSFVNNSVFFVSGFLFFVFPLWILDCLLAF